MGKRLAEYIWIDGYQPTPHLRSKTMVLPADEEPPIWGFDGSSTLQAEGNASDCVLRPVLTVADPIRGSDSQENILVMCEVLNTDLTPHASNMRHACQMLSEQYADQETWFGLEQEYTLFCGSRPLGWPSHGFPAPQGGYYCGVGADEVHGRKLVEHHLEMCLKAGLSITGVNAEVMPAQWEFQIGPLGAPQVADELWIARWLLYRCGEDIRYGPEGIGVSATLDPKPVPGDWNGAGCHTNVSTNKMRESYEECIAAVEALRERHEVHVQGYGEGVERRLTGQHETANYKQFSAGVSDRGASIRIPWQVEKNKCGYLEDRRPNANCDPYVVTRLLIETICGHGS